MLACASPAGGQTRDGSSGGVSCQPSWGGESWGRVQAGFRAVANQGKLPGRLDSQRDTTQAALGLFTRTCFDLEQGGNSRNCAPKAQSAPETLGSLVVCITHRVRFCSRPFLTADTQGQGPRVPGSQCSVAWQGQLGVGQGEVGRVEDGEGDGGLPQSQGWVSGESAPSRWAGAAGVGAWVSYGSKGAPPPPPQS